MLALIDWRMEDDNDQQQKDEICALEAIYADCFSL